MKSRYFRCICLCLVERALTGLNLPTMFEKTCRFCSENDEYCVQIFGEEGNKNRLKHKIRVCAPINVLENDLYPKQICLNCLSSLDQVYEFYQKIKVAQLKLKDMLDVAGCDSKEKKRTCSSPNEEGIPKKLCFGNTTITFESGEIPTEHEISTSNSEVSDVPISKSSSPLNTVLTTEIDEDPNISKSNKQEGAKSSSVNSSSKISPLGEESPQRDEENNTREKEKDESQNTCTENPINDISCSSGMNVETKSSDPEKKQSATNSPDPSFKPNLVQKTYQRSPIAHTVKSEKNMTVSPLKRLVCKPEPIMDASYSKKSPVEKPAGALFKKCRHCDKEFREDILLQHEKLHNGQPVFTCAECDRFFLHESTFEKHQCTPSTTRF